MNQTWQLFIVHMDGSTTPDAGEVVRYDTVLEVRHKNPEQRLDYGDEGTLVCYPLVNIKSYTLRKLGQPVSEELPDPELATWSESVDPDRSTVPWPE